MQYAKYWVIKLLSADYFDMIRKNYSESKKKASQ